MAEGRPEYQEQTQGEHEQNGQIRIRPAPFCCEETVLATAPLTDI